MKAACDLYPEEIVDEIRRAYEDDLIDPLDVTLPEIENMLSRGKDYTHSEIWLLRNGFIGDLVDEIGWWSCFDVDIADDEAVLKQRMNPYFYKSVAWS